ncbi:MAG TPA: hypothetical protein VN622_07045 [Clostridia bacterium]|nr:hypothetical protein [Clostridia bacterium]
MERGKAYGELDVTYQHEADVASFTPRIVVGVGRNVEIGLNFNGLNTAGNSQLIMSPTVKWKLYDGGKNGWAFLMGDSVFLPVQNRAYSAGSYLYAEFAKTFRTGTRATFGAFHFSRDVVASAQRAGGQFAIEQPIRDRMTLAADWYTGNHAVGYLTPGLIVKLTPKLTWYGSYQIGNGGVPKGNHQLLIEVGWNF